MSVKRILKISLTVLLVTVLVVGVASAVERRERRGGGRRAREPQGREWRGLQGPRMGICPMGGAFAGRTRPNTDRTGALEVPQEIREKFAEAQKAMIDLRTELGRNPVDREKALELHAKHRALMQEICDWRFARILDSLAER